MALTQVKTAGIAADAVTGAKIADDAINSEHYTDGSIDNAHVADDQINSEHYADASIDHQHLADDCVDSDNIADNSVGLAALANMGRGALLTGDASGDPKHLAAGSDNQVLTMDANGDFGWEAAAGAVTALNNATANELVTVASTTTQLDAEANLTFDGNHLTLGDGDLVIGTAGHGIDFSATTNRGTNASPSEILDDYEEGEWELQLYTGYDGSIPTNFSNYNCRYTKIGRFVHITANVRIDDAQTNNNCRFLLSSFPFGFHENSHAGIPVCFYYTNSQTVNAFIASNGYTYWQTTTVGGNNLGENCSWMDSVVNMTLSGCYITATDGGSV